jgi:translation initiation factor 2 subunit 3
VAEGCPIIPTSAIRGANVDAVLEYLATVVPVPQRDFARIPRLKVVRSFDINRPGAAAEELRGKAYDLLSLY